MKHGLLAKTPWNDYRNNEEEKSTQRGESANITWSVEKDGVRGKGFPHREGENSVNNFQERMLSLSEKSWAAPPDGMWAARLCSLPHLSTCNAAILSKKLWEVLSFSYICPIKAGKFKFRKLKRKLKRRFFASLRRRRYFGYCLRRRQFFASRRKLRWPW